MAFVNLYKRSIFFEILSLSQSGEPLTILESFAFTLPPSNVDIIQPQRITKTPTPGGYFIDNYGLDGAQITISGETGNDETRLTILGPGKTPKTLSGQEAYFEFRNRIVRYSQDSQNYTMRFYDLTHKGTANIFRSVSTSFIEFTEAWEVVMDDFASRRSSAKPFFYPYTINMLGIRPLGTFDPRGANNVIGFLSNIREAIDQATDAVEQFNANLLFFLDTNSEYLTDVTAIFESVTSFSDQLVAFTEQITEYEKKLGGLFEEVISESEEILTNGIQIIEFPYNIYETGRESVENIRAASESLFATVIADGKNAIDKYSFETSLDPVSQLSLDVTDIENAYYPIGRTVKQNSSYEPVGAVAVNGVVQLVYGFTEFTITENTRLDTLSRDLFGSPDFKDVISGINDLYSIDELVVGDMIRIPLLESNIKFANNAVYNLPGEREDILGRDAEIDASGLFVMNSTDYAVTAGVNTVLQNIGIRLAEKKGRQVQDGYFGVIAQIGSALNDDAPIEYIAVSLQETLLQDPRITSVYGLKFIASGDIVHQEFKFDTITKPDIVYREGI